MWIQACAGERTWGLDSSRCERMMCHDRASNVDRWIKHSFACVRACQMKRRPSEGRLWPPSFSGSDDKVCQCLKRGCRRACADMSKCKTAPVSLSHTHTFPSVRCEASWRPSGRAEWSTAGLHWASPSRFGPFSCKFPQPNTEKVCAVRFLTPSCKYCRICVECELLSLEWERLWRVCLGTAARTLNTCE